MPWARRGTRRWHLMSLAQRISRCHFFSFLLLVGMPFAPSFLFLVVRPGAPSSFLFLVVRPRAPSSFLFLVVGPGAPSSFLLLFNHMCQKVYFSFSMASLKLANTPGRSLRARFGPCRCSSFCDDGVGNVLLLAMASSLIASLLL